MFKVTVIYNHPTDPEAFEKYYAETHTPIAMKIPTLIRMELTKFLDMPDGKAAYYRMSELCFATAEDMQSAMASAEAQAAHEYLEEVLKSQRRFPFIVLGIICLMYAAIFIVWVLQP